MQTLHIFQLLTTAAMASAILASGKVALSQDAVTPKREGVISLVLRNGSVLEGATDVKLFEVETVYGKLKVPVSEIVSIRIGTKSMPDLKKRIDALIVDLGDNSYEKRENASKELAKLGVLAQTELETAAKSSDPEVVMRARGLLEELGQDGETQPQDDEVEAKAFAIRGTVRFETLSIVTKRGIVKVEKKGIINVTIGDPANDPSLLTGLIAHWKLDESAGTNVRDSTGNGNHGILKGGASWIRGKINNGLNFDGTSRYVAATGVDLANKSFSIAAWLKADTSKMVGVVLSQGESRNSHRLNFCYGGKTFYLGFYNDDLSVSYEPDNSWHLWTATYDAATRAQSIYRDGVLVGSRIANAHYQGGGDLYLGQVSFEGNSYLKGILDDVRVYNRALTKEEIKMLTNLGR